jgi:hypothetical protein
VVAFARALAESEPATRWRHVAAAYLVVLFLCGSRSNRVLWRRRYNISRDASMNT